MPRLRGHHLICLHFFCGEGYDASFVKNLRNVLSRSENNEVEIISGADDICIKCLHLKDGRCLYNEEADEDIKEMDKHALSLLDLGPGIGIGWEEIRERLPGIFQEWYKKECIKCNWRWACEKNSLYQQLKAKE